MKEIIPFVFDDHQIRVVRDNDGSPLFVGKDICEALGYTNPNKAMSDHCKGVTKRYTLQTAGGVQQMRVLTEGDMYRLMTHSKLESAERFESLVFDEILPTIRKTGKYEAKSGGDQQLLAAQLEAFKHIPMVVRAARAFGLDKNAAAISANQAIAKITGVNALNLLGHTHLVSEQQAIFFTPTELGERIGMSARKFNLLLAEAGMQAKNGDHWVPLGAAKEVCRIMDTGKRHGDGTMIQQIKWSDEVLELVNPDVNPKEAA